MKKETLTWKVDKTIPTACPNYKPDPYTGEYPTFHCLVYHYETITESKAAEFDIYEKAIEFAKKAPNSCYDFKLNGELLNDNRKRASNITINNIDLTGGAGATTIAGDTNLSGDNQ